MKLEKLTLTSLTIVILMIWSLPISQASLNSPIKLDNPRVVPIFGHMADQAGWSGYLYSSRIVFSAAHSHYRFDSSGNRILSEAPSITVGKPNSAASDRNGRVRVIKTFVGDYKTSTVGGLNDFIVYVLEKDLIPITPGKLLTASIEKELVVAQADVTLHGYGEYQDRCGVNETLPCEKDWNDPKMRTSEYPRSPTGTMKLVEATYFPWLEGSQLRDLSKESLLSDNLACSGDSGGPLTALYKGESIYLGTAPLGFTPGYYCGAGKSRTTTKPSGYFSPVYKHLDLIKQAEDFISTNKKDSTITCVKGKATKSLSSANAKCPKGYRKK